MAPTFDVTDVPVVSAAELYRPMQMLIARGQALALLKGLTERELRELEEILWRDCECDRHARIAVALRFRALVDVFAARRLKDLLIERGFRVIAAAIAAAAQQRLNARFGFSAQRLLQATDAATRPARPVSASAFPVSAAA